MGIAHVGLDGRWLRVNARLAEVLGYTRDELLARTFQDVTQREDLDADVAQVCVLLGGDTGRYAMDKRYVRRDGSHVWVRLTVSLARTADGQPDQFISVVEDIGARKRAEADQQFLLDLGVRLALIADPAEIGRAAARALGERLDVSRCFFADVDLERDGHPDGVYVIRGMDYDAGARDGSANPFSIGESPVNAFASNFGVDARAGQPTVVDDPERAWAAGETAGLAAAERAARVEAEAFAWQLQKQAAELEAANEALQAAAGELEERTAGAERARDRRRCPRRRGAAPCGRRARQSRPRRLPGEHEP